LDATKNTLQSSLLPDEIRYDGLPLGRVLNIKFKYWDLADNYKFPELAEDKLLPRKWLVGVENVDYLI